jgi:ethanolamine permease
VNEAAEGHLKKTLGPLMLWGLGVGYVISGIYFGWNLGLPDGGSVGMLAVTLVVTVMYAGFILSYAELSCAIPKAGGVFVYAGRALGSFGGFVAGLAQIVEFVIAPAPIAAAIGAYVQQRYPDVDPRATAVLMYLAFTGLNVWGVRAAAGFELLVTVLAVAELLVFVLVVGPSFSSEAFFREPLPKGWGGVLASLPFAIWFYLGIEGVANAAEEARRPERDVARGFGAAMATLIVLTLLVYFAAIGAGGWRAIVYAAGSETTSDAPLPLALGVVISDKTSALYTLLLGVGLLGLIASFHGILLAAGRATMEFGRAGFLPPALGAVHPRTGTPLLALVLNMMLGVVAILSGKTGDIIILSVFGALVLYILALVSLFRLRKTEPELVRPFLAVGFPVLPGVALLIAALSLAAMIWLYAAIAAIFFAVLAAGAVFYRTSAAARIDPRWAHR